MRKQVSAGDLAASSLLACLLAAPAVAGTNVKYNYVGMVYTYNYPSTGCLTKLMHLSVSLTLPKALAANTANQTVTPVSWTISNGLHSYASSVKKPASPTPILTAKFSTNAAGQITDWNIYSVFYFPGSADFVEYSATSSWNSTSKTGGDYSADYTCTTSQFTAEIASNGVPGHWVKK